METTETIFTRHSIRSFSADPIPPEILDEILQAGRLAPSAQNRQPWRFIVIQGADKVKSLSVNCGLIGLSNFFIRSAPVVIIACADTKRAMTINKQDYYLVDTAIAFQQMMLQAWNHGIGSCWLAAFSEKKIRTWLDLPKSWRIVGLSPFGYPSEKKSFHAKLVSSFAKSADRLPMTEIVQYY
ncbi:MAG: nitroreductase family protein [Candidatus Cloacimonetes bacterium HGW-Cloacimonetes-1]|jgi:nitroreductase|nr:MAG: nitroreductase family protein [Candidatus Cloacimonetes bacterium HGW-Cloacimonetes-1]